ncbi:MAG: hypothetical protein methR_PLP0024 (plasmid) [Methyloprofundus sp.]|nr:MAG: hypothetical protein methR_PLP0024 [Methyloprofundus sp.]
MGDLPLLGTNAQIIRIVEALFGVQPGNTFYTNFQDYVAETSVDALSNALVGALAPADAESLAATVAANYQVDADLETDDGSNVIELLETYITAQLNTVPEAEWGAKVLEITNQYTNLWTDPLLGESVTKFNDMVVKSLVYSANPANPDVNNPDGGPVVGDDILLTTAQDNLAGTDANDVFNAFIFDNQNTLQSGDILDGGAGTDTLFADIGNSQNFAITPHTTSVEKLLVRAEAAAETNDSNDNNMSTAVQIDAERMKGTNWYESNNSRADVIIEDVRVLRKDAYGDESDQITQDVTVAMVSTDPGLVDLGVYFDQHSLTPEGEKESNSITLSVGNQLEIDKGFDSEKPLDDIPYTKVAFLVNEQPVILSFDLTAVDTYDQMWVAIEDAFNAAKADGPFSDSLQGIDIVRKIDSDQFISKDGEKRFADEYELTAADGKIAPDPTIGWALDGVLPPNNAFSATVAQGDPQVTSNLITANILLDDVGRGSMGGDLVVGGLSIGADASLVGTGSGATSNSKGVEQFDIIVERNSELQEIQSTNNTLEVVNIVNGDNKGNLVVAGDTNVDNDLPGADADARGLTDVRVLDASTMEGTVALDAVLSGAVVGKYLERQDFATNAAADNVDFKYDLGTNDDSLVLGISSANLEVAGTNAAVPTIPTITSTGTTTREDFILDVNGNSGNDKITTLIGTGAGTATTNWYINSKINANLTVNGDAGDDTIRTQGAGDFNINGGSGNDTVYANNDGIGIAPTGSGEIQTLNFAGLTAEVGGTVQVGITSLATVNPVVPNLVTLFADDNDQTIAARVLAKLNTLDNVGLTGDDVNGDGVVDTFAITGATAAVAEVQTITFAGPLTGSGNIQININGTPVTTAVLNTDTATTVAQKVQNAVTAAGIATVASVTESSGALTITYTTAAGDVAPVVLVAAGTTATAAAPLLTTATGTDFAAANTGTTVQINYGTQNDIEQLSPVAVDVALGGATIETAANTAAVNSTVATTTEGDGAAISEVQTIDFTGLIVDTTGSIMIGGHAVTIFAGDNAAAIAARVALALNTGLVDIDGDGVNELAGAATAAANVVTLTYDGFANKSQIVVADGSATYGWTGTETIPFTVTQGTAGTAEVTVLDFSGLTFTGATNAANLTIGDGATVTVALANGDTAAQMAAKAAIAINGNNVDSEATADIAIATGNTVTITSGAVGVRAADISVTAENAASQFAKVGSITSTAAATSVDGFAGSVATWAVNAANRDISNLQSNPEVADGILFKSMLTVTYSGARNASSGVINDAANDFSNGFEKKVPIGTTDNLGSRLQVNQAIKDAINNDATLSKLLMATDGPANTLVITSLVDGRFEANDLEIKIMAPTSLTATELSSLNATHKDLVNNSALADLNEAGMLAVIDAQIAAIDAGGAYTTETLATQGNGGAALAGTTSISDSDNTIDLGTGTDVAVLGTDASSNDTLVMEGSFGDDSIFNFVNTAGDTGLDMLDFTAYLTNDISTSNSASSTVRIATTGENTGVAASILTANEVATVNDFAENTASSATETWANLTAADLLAAIQETNTTGTKDYGNIVESSFDVNTVADLVGNVQNGIIMVENDKNDGEYKVFSTFANDTDKDFTSITLVGTIDFGDTIDASVAGALV